jgi:hypothetical protein
MNVNSQYEKVSKREVAACLKAPSQHSTGETEKTHIKPHVGWPVTRTDLQLNEEQYRT